MLTFIHKSKLRLLALKRAFVIIEAVLVGWFAAPQASADSFDNPILSSTFADLVEKIAKAVSAIAIPFVAIFLVWSGFLFVTARGNEEQLKTAKKTLMWALIGGAVVVGAYALSAAVVNFAKKL